MGDFGRSTDSPEGTAVAPVNDALTPRQARASPRRPRLRPREHPPPNTARPRAHTVEQPLSCRRTSLSPFAPTIVGFQCGHPANDQARVHSVARVRHDHSSVRWCTVSGQIPPNEAHQAGPAPAPTDQTSTREDQYSGQPIHATCPGSICVRLADSLGSILRPSPVDDGRPSPARRTTMTAPVPPHCVEQRQPPSRRTAGRVCKGECPVRAGVTEPRSTA